MSAGADPPPGLPLPFWSSLKADLVAHVPPERRSMSRSAWALAGLGVAARSSGFHVTFSYRAAHALRPRLGPLGRAASSLIFWWVRHAYACAIAPTSRLHGGLILPHPQGIVVGGDAEVGPRCWIYHNVTLGGTVGRAGCPRVGADSRIFAGAVLVGPIVLGHGVMVGANVVVTRDVPDRCFVRPAPPTVAPISPPSEESP